MFDRKDTYFDENFYYRGMCINDTDDIYNTDRTTLLHDYIFLYSFFHYYMHIYIYIYIYITNCIYIYNNIFIGSLCFHSTVLNT